MNKAEFIKTVAENTTPTQTQTAETITEALKVITEALSAGESIDFTGFGKFTTKLQKGKTGTVPGTDKTYTTVDKMVPKFKASKMLRDKVSAGI